MSRMARQEAIDALTECRSLLAALGDICDAIEAEANESPDHWGITGDAKALRSRLEQEVESLVGYRMRRNR